MPHRVKSRTFEKSCKFSSRVKSKSRKKNWGKGKSACNLKEPDLRMQSTNSESGFDLHTLNTARGRDSSVGIANGWLRAGRSGDRIPVGVRFFSHVQTVPGAHPASCTMGAGTFPEVATGQGVVLTIHPLLAPRSRAFSAISQPPSLSFRVCYGVPLPSPLNTASFYRKGTERRTTAANSQTLSCGT
jgi:hypothetical protein